MTVEPTSIRECFEDDSVYHGIDFETRFHISGHVFQVERE